MDPSVSISANKVDTSKKQDGTQGKSGGGGSQHGNYGGGSSSNHFSGGNGGSSNQSFSGGGSFNYGGGSQQSQGKQFGGNFGGKKITCWHCRQPGHYSTRCPDRENAKAVEVMNDDQEDDRQMVSFHSLHINRVEIAASSSDAKVPVNGVGTVVGRRRRRCRRQQRQQQHHGVYPVNDSSSRGGSSPQVQVQRRRQQQSR